MSSILVAALAAGLSASAGDVTGLTTFTPGTPAKASEVNGNFGIVADAVNSKQDRVTGACAAGNAISAVAANGSVTCVPLIADGAVSVPGTALVPSSPAPSAACRLFHSQNWSYFLGSEEISGCYAFAPLTLPDGALLTNLSCLVNDNYAAGDIRVALYRRSLTSEAVQDLFETPRSVDGGLQTVLDDSADGAVVVDNNTVIYGLFASFEPDSNEFFDDVTVNLALTGCSIGYQSAP